MKKKWLFILLLSLPFGMLTACGSGKPAESSSNGISESSNSEQAVVFHTVTFDPNNGDPSFTQQVENGKKAAKPEDPTKEGHTFDGWYHQSGDRWSFVGYVVTDDMTLTANYDVNQYTITFEDGFGNTLSTIAQDYGTAIKAPTDPTKTGHTFRGWSRDIPSTMPAENLLIEAVWHINQYIITFEDGFGHTLSTIAQDYGTEITPPADPTNEYYEFSGWDQQIPTTMPATDITIRATWSSSIFNFSGTTLTSYTGNASSVRIPEYTPFGAKVTSIGSCAFYGCSSLASVNIPSGVTSIRSSAFKGCSSLASVNIPSGVTSIPLQTFYGCSSLASVFIPDSVTSIGDSAFFLCSSLASVNIPSGVTSIGSCAFFYCSSLASVNIPSGVTSICGSAFYGCSSLASVFIPDSVTSIVSGAFSDCSSLSVYCEAASKPSGWDADLGISSDQFHWGVTYDEYLSIVSGS